LCVVIICFLLSAGVLTVRCVLGATCWLVVVKMKAGSPKRPKKEMRFERVFAEAGSLLLASPDPRGNSGVLRASPINSQTIRRRITYKAVV